MQNLSGTVLALDVGEKRIGVAVATSQTRLPRPLPTLEHTGDILQKIQDVITAEQVEHVVIGLPRGLSGQRTAQTEAVEAFAAGLKQGSNIPLYWQDEAVTSHQAEAELKRRGKPYAKGDIDALAAAYILEDFLNDHSSEKII
jgi:putative holliday junction resolvase